MYISNAGHSGIPESPESEMMRKARRLRVLAEQLSVIDPEGADACETAADVLESLAEPVVAWG